MINRPLVTIVTITLNLLKNNRQTTFLQMVQSIQSQSYDSIEHLIIDGASTDGTVELLQNLQDKFPNIKVYSEPDKGIYDAMNKGIQQANGKYVAFLNSDDFYHDPRGIEKAVRLLEKKQADYCYSPCRLLNKNDQFVNMMNGTSQDTLDWSFYQIPFNHPTMVSKKSLLQKYLFNTNYRLASDYDQILRVVIDRNKSAFLKDAFVSFRLTGFSVKNNELNRRESIQIIYENLKKFYDQLTKEDAQNIFDHRLLGFPLPLAVALKDYKQAFNWTNYVLALNHARLKAIDQIKGHQAHPDCQGNSIAIQELNQIKSSKIWAIFVIYEKLKQVLHLERR